MDPKYAGIMGYKEEEIKIYFKEHVREICKMRTQQVFLTSEEKVIDEIRTWYNGYRFSEENL